MSVILTKLLSALLFATMVADAAFIYPLGNGGHIAINPTPSYEAINLRLQCTQFSGPAIDVYLAVEETLLPNGLRVLKVIDDGNRLFTLDYAERHCGLTSLRKETGALGDLYYFNVFSGSVRFRFAGEQRDAKP
ncbi:hypothetical protein FOZ63_029157 [Perkinsus olseni]|uniref:Uncharacterized protein n=1 Tax=Perkinsus olseni TaxID=32597 RepID=A0A7J6PRY2_PEROL|nr:hypothetical protein FOZ62_015958 [Perkinsus olseni]KAF4698888.1 hypothetical protein FOZ63_029157 [Perkinsus olseni]